jgi:hypothetical protein
MAKAVVAAWTACVKDLQQQVAAASATTPAPGGIIMHASTEFRSSMRCLMKLKEEPQLPHAAWKKLVHDVQVMCWGKQDMNFHRTDRSSARPFHKQLHF